MNINFSTLVIVIFSFMTSQLKAQIPSEYYNSAYGLSGYTLKTELSEIITAEHTPQSYGDLWDAYYTSDVDNYYENDGTLLDIYSENPTGNDAYTYALGNNQCGNYSEEGDCYNREHLFPKSYFDDQAPMQTDIHHIYPTDGWVNGQRGNFPYGETTNPDYTSTNGSKKGNNTYNHPQAYSGTVFEPIDEFKGDIARVYFYMATRYESQIATWETQNEGSENTLNGTSTQVFENWMLEMLLEWHNNDPVSQKEIDRNNAAYNFQQNRNPYIDHPELVSYIWGEEAGETWNEVMDTPKLSETIITIYPNPTSTGYINLKTSGTKVFSYKLYALNGKLLQKGNIEKQSINLSNLSSGMYLMQISSDRKKIVKKLFVE